MLNEALEAFLIQCEKSLVEKNLLGLFASRLEHEFGALLALNLGGAIDQVLLRGVCTQVDVHFASSGH